MAKCPECNKTWSDGIAGCPHCGWGNPFKGIECLTPLATKIAAAEKERLNDR